MYNPSYYILTGGPGSGKTSVIEILRKRGFNCIEEVARKLIRDQVLIGGDALPWINIDTYSEWMFKNSIRDFTDNINIKEICFFDRGIPDTLAHIRVNKLPGYEKYRKTAERYIYNKTVFAFPPWEEIYHMDNERKQDFTTAIQTYTEIRKVYTGLGYSLIEVPRLPIAERADFIIEHITNQI